MFDIEYKGGNCVVISTKKTTLVTDPKISLLGLKDVKINEAIELSTEERFSLNSSDVKVAIDSPGEYEAGDFTIKGVSATRHIDSEDTERLSTIYRVEVGECAIGVLGNISPILSEDQLEAVGVVDILIIPVGGGGYTLDATSAASIVRSIDPKVIIPIHYADNSLKYEVPQESLDVFVKEMGVEAESSSKYKIKSAASLPPALTIQELTRS